MITLQIQCGGLFLYRHLKLAIDKEAKEVYIVLSREFLLLVISARNEVCRLVDISRLG